MRRAVFDATLRLLAEGGYGALSMDAVAAAAGVNKTTVYRNWPTRAALILAAAEDRSATVINTRVSGHPEADLLAFLRSVEANLRSPLGHALMVATLGNDHDPDVNAARRVFWRHRFEAAAPLVRAALPAAVSTAEVDAAIETLIAPIFLRVFVTGAPISDAWLRRHVRQVARGGSAG